MVLRLLWKELAQNVEVSPVLFQQQLEQLDLLCSPQLALLLRLDRLTARDGVRLAHAERRLRLGLLLP